MLDIQTHERNSCEKDDDDINNQGKVVASQSEEISHIDNNRKQITEEEVNKDKYSMETNSANKQTGLKSNNTIKANFILFQMKKLILN